MKMTFDTQAQQPSTPSSSKSLLSAALMGLLGVTAAACGSDEKPANDDRDDQEQDAGSKDKDAGNKGDEDRDASGDGDAGAMGPIVTEEIPGERSYESLAKDCDERGGYVQIHASCSGSNSCKGFSYGDWGKDAVLTEHTCASMNGCKGLSCVVLPEDSGKSGEEVYAFDLPPAGPSSCVTCHAVTEHDANGGYLPPDVTKFKVWVMPGSTRTTDNWLELSAEAQEQIVAFGKIGAFEDGVSVVSMKGYHQLYSRAETERVVAHIRTLTPIIEEIGRPK
jgi:hypothetical protein